MSNTVLDKKPISSAENYITNNGLLWFLIALAFVFWFIMFSPWTSPHVNFWAVMALAASILAGSSLFFDKRTLREYYAWKNEYIAIGLISAAILYGVFFFGDVASRFVLSFAGRDIENIYSTKAQASPLVIGLLLFFWVGPAEEIFWRGFVQTRLNQLFSRVYTLNKTTNGKSVNGSFIVRWLSDSNVKAFIATSFIYALVHIWGFNLMLFGAALVCGLFWGAMYLKYKSVWPGLISHAVWDLVIFVLWPVQR